MAVRDKLHVVKHNGPIVDRPGGGGDDGDMEARVAKLEDFAKDTSEKLVGIGERLVRIETRMEAFATKADLHDMTSQMIKWVVGAAVGLGIAGITVMTFVLNNAIPKAQTAQPAPIIITVPAQAAAPVPAVKPASGP